MSQLTCLTPIGEVTLSEAPGADGRTAIVALDWGRGRDQARSPLLVEAVRQLQDYLDGTRTGFDLPLDPHGTPFRRRVWQALREIPPGQTRSYGDFARQLGTSARAIGQAMGTNPIPIIIPCHRILAAGGALGGYSGGEGSGTKRFLLDLERRLATAAAAPQSELDFPHTPPNGTTRR